MRWRRIEKAGLLPSAAIGIALVAEACGGGSANGVARIGHPVVARAGRPAGAHLAPIQGGLAHSQCMRAHGVLTYPDPDAQGNIKITSASGLNPSSPQFDEAQKACANLEPGGSSQGITPWGQAMLVKALKFVACMRTHGVHNFPDPKPLPYGVMLTIPRSSGIDVNSPQFTKANQICQPLMNVDPGTGKP